jgi:hypothetical protein
MLTEGEKVQARHHLGYLNVAAQSTFSLGVPAGVQTQFTIEGAMNRILPQAEPLFRRHLRILEALECQILENAPNVAVTSIDTIKIDPKAFKQTVEQYRYWGKSLANLMGCTPNPFDQRFVDWAGMGGGGINVGMTG